MSLPQLNTPIYTLELPSNKKKIKFRPFLVKEEKIVMIALQNQSETVSIIDTIKEVIKSCLLEKIDIDTLPYFDIEYIFLQMRIRSKGPNSKLQFICKNEVDGKECGTTNTINFDLTQLNVVFDANHNKKFNITDTIGIEMKYPTMSDLVKIEKAKDNVKEIYDIAAQFISTVYDTDGNIYDFTKEEAIEWLEQLTGDQFEKIKNFFETMPKIRHTIKLGCSKCGNEESFELVGLQNFLV